MPETITASQPGVNATGDPTATLPLIIDLSHFQPNPNLKAAREQSGIAACIHKATQGMTMVDAQYESALATASAIGMLWGAYHFLTDTDGTAQAVHFLDVVKPDKGTLLAVDFETSKVTPTLAQLLDFIAHVQSAGHRICLYSGNLIKEKLGAAKNTALDAVPLWLADYSEYATWPQQWTTWFMWQYTQTANIAGIKHPCDCSRFNGTLNELRACWHS